MTHVEPQVVSASGGSLVTVSGVNFPTTSASGVVCRFGHNVIPAAVLSATQATCITPAQAVGFRAVDLTFSNNAEFYVSDSFVQVITEKVITDLSMSPSEGSAAGGTVVTITGNSFNEHTGGMFCKFGTADPVEATFVSSTTLHCTTPRHRRTITSVQLIPFNVSLSEDVNAEATAFRFKRADRIGAVVPTQAETLGGTIIRAMSTNTPDDGVALWRFGGTVVVAARKAAMGIIEAVVPAMLGGNTTIEVSVNGWDFTPACNFFTYVMPANVSAVDPTVLVQNGGRDVLVTGMGFSNSDQAYCGVGGLSPKGSSWAYTMGTVLSSTTMRCVLPARGGGMRALEVALTKGGKLTRSGVQVEYVSAGDVTAMYPATGTYMGGTTVTIDGVNFVAGRTACRIGGQDVEADVTSSVAARCVVPAAKMGSVSMDVTTSYQGSSVPASESFESGQMFAYDGKIAMRRVQPTKVVEEGGQLVKVKVAGAMDGVRAVCAFGRTLVVAEEVRNGNAECMVPAGLAGNYTVEASINGQDFTSNSGITIQLLPSLNLTSVSPVRLPVAGDRNMVLKGSFQESTILYCAVGGSTTEGSSWVYALAHSWTLPL